ncbi:MAG: molecular chaperone DnaK [Firmicutes bacterium]|nr:molecular chaperone DnaK [Bacillota bacterium]
MGKIIGIDLGTTNSLAAVMEGGEPVVVTNSEGSHLTPSVVGFTKSGERVVGELAKRQAVSNPERTILSIKRQMGTDFKARIDEHEYTPQEISAMILQKIKTDAEASLGESVEKAVITVPAYFNDAERQATKDAGTIAGLEVVRIVNEPTAAAMAYGLDKMEGNQTVLVFDLGGGTFDVSILTIDNGVFEVVSTSGDMKLGGDDWDRRIMDYLVDGFKKASGIDLRIDRIAMQRLKEAAEAAKWELSEKETARINLPFIAADPSGPKHLDMELTREKFEELTKDLVEQLAGPSKRALDDAKIPLGQISKVILVGGSTRMPMVQRMAQKLFLKEPSKEVDPDKVVAMGAAIQGAVLAGEVKDLVLLDVTSLSLGIETTGGAFTRIIERNTQIPCSKSKIFTTVVDGQTSVEVRVYQGERELAQHNKFLGSFDLRNIPPAPRGVPQIEVAFEIDANGIVSSSAKDMATGNKQKIVMQSPTGLSQEEINRMIKEAQQFADEDIRLREERQIRNKAVVEIDVAEKTLKDYGQIFEADKVQQVRLLITTVKDFLEKREYDKIKEETKALQDAVFALTTQLYLAPQKAGAGIAAGSSTQGSEGLSQEKGEEPTQEEIFGWFDKQKP